MQPWELNPYEPISWLDMLNFSADAFYSFGRALRDIRCDCYIAAASCVDGNAEFFVLRFLDDRARQKAITNLNYVATHSENLGMFITSETARETIADLKTTKFTIQWLLDRTANIEGIVTKELRGKAFFYIPSERMKYWPQSSEPHAFGKAVADKFPSTEFDATKAAICLAITLSTSAVFHLMRVLEIGLMVLGTKFGVSLAHTNWGPAIGEIESKIRDMHRDPVWKSMPDCKEQQEFYSQAASHFGIVKDAWRNYTMHVRAQYDQDKAELIFLNVKSFMQKLAERLHE